MKINSNFKIRQIAGEYLVVNQGSLHEDMTKIISLNTTAHLLWTRLADRDFSVAEAAQVMVDEYGIDAERATTDVTKWIESMKACHIIDD